MELKKEIRILGRRFEVEPRAKESLKGITVGEKLSYRFYDAFKIFCKTEQYAHRELIIKESAF